MGRIILIGLLAGSIMLALGMLVSRGINFVYPELATEYENSNLFRSWSDPVMLYYFIHPFVTGIILAWLWSKTNHLIPESIAWKRGIYFGLIYSIVTIGGMLMSYSSFSISFSMMMSWFIGSVIQVCCAGLVYAKFLLKN